MIRAMLPPREITPSVSDFARKILDTPDINLEWVHYSPLKDAEISSCFPTVARHIAAKRGEMVYGWAFSEWPGVWLEAEFHAVWRSPKGNLRDLTPRPIPGWKRTLFLHDPARRYEGRQVQSRIRPLVNDKSVDGLIAAMDAQFEFMNRGDRAEQHMLNLSQAEALEMEAINLQVQDRLQDVVRKYPLDLSSGQ